MMTESRIRLAPTQAQVPSYSRLPIMRARRWYSPYEERDGMVPAVQVYVTQRAYVRFCAHAGTDLDNEVGGGLVGCWRSDPRTRQEFIVVEAVLPAKHTRQGGTFVTFTQDSLVALRDDLEARFPGKQLIGWYHTHPRMGVFLSGYDVWLHEHFFSERWQVALVIEPYSVTGGFFIRQMDGRLDPRNYFGFYELTPNKSRQVVHWVNLESDENAPNAEPVSGEADAAPELASDVRGHEGEEL